MVLMAIMLAIMENSDDCGYYAGHGGCWISDGDGINICMYSMLV